MKNKIYVNVGKTGILFASEEPVELKDLQDNCNEEYIRAKTLLKFLDEFKNENSQGKSLAERFRARITELMVETIKDFIEKLK